MILDTQVIAIFQELSEEHNRIYVMNNYDEITAKNVARYLYSENISESDLRSIVSHYMISSGVKVTLDDFVSSIRQNISIMKEARKDKARSHDLMKTTHQLINLSKKMNEVFEDNEH